MRTISILGVSTPTDLWGFTDGEVVVCLVLHERFSTFHDRGEFSCVWGYHVVTTGSRLG